MRKCCCVPRHHGVTRNVDSIRLRIAKGVVVSCAPLPPGAARSFMRGAAHLELLHGPSHIRVLDVDCLRAQAEMLPRRKDDERIRTHVVTARRLAPTNRWPNLDIVDGASVWVGISRRGMVLRPAPLSSVETSLRPTGAAPVPTKISGGQEVGTSLGHSLRCG